MKGKPKELAGIARNTYRCDGHLCKNTRLQLRLLSFTLQLEMRPAARDSSNLNLLTRPILSNGFDEQHVFHAK